MLLAISNFGLCFKILNHKGSELGLSAWQVNLFCESGSVVCVWGVLHPKQE